MRKGLIMERGGEARQGACRTGLGETGSHERCGICRGGIGNGGIINANNRKGYLLLQ